MVGAFPLLETKMVVRNPLQVQNVPRVGRSMRTPTHRWNLRSQPWQIQPVLIAPVIPGESLKNAVLQARVVTDPVKNRLIGWWQEYYLYYVPFRAMAAADELTQMVIDPEWTPAAIDSNTAVPKEYFYGRNSINFVRQCLDAVVNYDFREPHEVEDGLVHEIDGLPISTINTDSWTNSLINDNAMIDYDVAVVDGPDAGSVLNASEVEIAMQQYAMLRDAGLVEMTYEDYLKTYGIKGKAVDKVEEFHPELLRYMRNWQYPSNTVDATGAVSSAVSWSIAERVDKDRFFKEPGFIIGLSICRPKVYLGNQEGAAASMLDSIRSWLPRVMSDDPYTSMKRFANGEGPMTTGFADTAPAASDATPTQAYWVDVRDLFLHGDQFVNNATAYEVPLPDKTGNLSYASANDYDTLFVEQTGTRQHIEQDGTCSFVIAGSQKDLTAPAVARTVV